MKGNRTVMLTICVVLNYIVVSAQISNGDNKFPQLEPIAIAEIWSTYSYGESMNNETYANQYDIHFRRLRFGAKGKANKWLKYSFLIDADRLGENKFASTKNKYQGVGLWCAMMSVKLSKTSNLMNLHTGYYNIAVSRESYTAFKTLGTLDKVQPDWYLRQFITGKGNGIETGIGLAGDKYFDKFGFSYRTSIFIPESYHSATNNSLLCTYRVMASIGDNSSKTHSYLIKNQNWKNQKQIEFGVGGSYQHNGYLNDSLTFKKSGSFGSDILLHYHNFIIDGSYYRLFREANYIPDFSAFIWHVRSSYNFMLFQEHLEFCLSYQEYSGNGNKVLYKYIGGDLTIDSGFNWYVNNEKVKIALHYINQSGDASMNVGDYFACSILMTFN